MRQLLILVITVLLCLSLALPAFAHDDGPCNDNGEPGNSDYAQHHIIPATANGPHVPGVHGGFSACLDTGR